MRTGTGDQSAVQPNCTFVHLVIKRRLGAIKYSLTSDFPPDPSCNIRLITMGRRVKRCRSAEGEDANESRKDVETDTPTHT